MNLKSANNQLPPFLFREKVDSGKEAVQDFILAWTIRCSAEKYSMVNPILHEYAKRITFLLIYGEHRHEDDRYTIEGFEVGGIKVPSNFKIKEVNVIRQKIGKIDLVIEVKLEEGEEYVLNIENKVYTKPRKWQLENGLKAVNENVPNLREKKLINLLIYIDEEIIFHKKKPDVGKQLREKCKRLNYKFPDIYT